MTTIVHLPSYAVMTSVNRCTPTQEVVPISPGPTVQSGHEATVRDKPIPTLQLEESCISSSDVKCFSEDVKFFFHVISD